MTVHLVISLPKIPYIHRIYIWFWPTLLLRNQESGCCAHCALVHTSKTASSRKPFHRRQHSFLFTGTNQSTHQTGHLLSSSSRSIKAISPHQGSVPKELPSFIALGSWASAQSLAALLQVWAVLLPVVCVYMCVCVCVCVWMFVCVGADVRVWMWVCADVDVNVCTVMCTDVRVDVCMRVWMCVYAHALCSSFYASTTGQTPE